MAKLIITVTPPRDR